jgi:transposase
MARYGRLLTDAQWEKIHPWLPKRPRRPQGGRRPADDRKVLEGILWILRSGAIRSLKTTYSISLTGTSASISFVRS